MKLGKIFTFIIGVIVGIVLVFGGTIGLGYYFVTREGGVGKTADLASRSGLFDSSNIPKAIRNQSIYQYTTNVVKVASDYRTKTIGDIEEAMGINTISNTLYNQLGVPKDVTKASLLPNIGKTITDHLTVGNVSDKLGLEYPDFPLFENEEFLSSPISTAFSSLDTYTLDAFIYVTYDESASEDSPPSSAILQKLGKVEISQMSRDMDGILDDLFLHEIITNPNEDDIINEFLHLKVGELGTELQATLDALPLKDIMKIDETSPKVLRALQDCTLVTQYEDDGITPITQSLSDGLKYTSVSQLVDTPEDSYIWNYLGDATLDNLGQKVEDMTVAEAIDTSDPDCHILIKRLSDSKVADIGVNLGGVVAQTQLGEIITIDQSTAEPILLALKDTFLTSEDLNASLAELRVKDVFRNYSTGILALVSYDTYLSLLPVVLADAITNSSIYRLSIADVYSIDMTGSSYETKAFVYNQTPDQLMQSYINIANDPALALSMTPHTISYNAPILDQDALDVLVGFDSGATLVVTGDVVIPNDTVFNVVFNIQVSEGSSLTIGDNVVVDLGQADGGYMFLKGSVLGSNITSMHEIAISPNTSVPAVLIEYAP